MISLSTFGRFLAILALWGAATLTSSAAPARPETVTPHARTLPEASRSAAKSRRHAEQRFDGAFYGVDPIVTGPVSAAFKERQKKSHCAEAVWPNIPATCYPD